MTTNNRLPVLTRRTWLAVALVLAAFVTGLLLRPAAPDSAVGTQAGQAAAATPTRWTCSMHPQIILPSNDQKCPICFMDLIPLTETGADGLDPGQLRLTEAAAAMAEVATERVTRRFVDRSVRLVGKVAPDETLLRTITARVGGRLDRLHVDATGQAVTRGMKLAEIYSPELYTAQAELQAAVRAQEGAADGGVLSGSAARTVEAATAKLRLLGLDAEQIAGIGREEGFSEHVTVRAPGSGVVIERKASTGDYVKTGTVLYTIADLSRVWIALEAYESDVPWLHLGQAVDFTTRAMPGRTLSGEIRFIDPVLDEKTRTVEVRVAVDNRGGLLKPGMLVTGSVAATLDAEGAPVADRAQALAPLVIPATAPLLTGERAVVYVREEHPDGAIFSGREVVLGPRAGAYFLVVSGLAEGEQVVTRGNFKIDSALQILAQPSMMNPQGGGAAGGHQHGGATAEVSAAPVTAPPCIATGLQATLTTYYELQTALAGDDDGRGARAAARLRDVLADFSCDTSALDQASGGLWAQLLVRLRQEATAVAQAGDLAARRLAFEPLSTDLWQAVSSFQWPAGEPVRRFHCPMAMDGAGAYWLQAGETTANPYYGAAMLRCGSQVAAIGAVDREGQ